MLALSAVQSGAHNANRGGEAAALLASLLGAATAAAVAVGEAQLRSVTIEVSINDDASIDGSAHPHRSFAAAEDDDPE